MQKIKLGKDLEDMTKTEGWKAVESYIKKDKEAIKEFAINPGYKDYETYIAYRKAYEVYDQLEKFIARSVRIKNKLNEQSKRVADTGQNQ